MLGAIIGDIAGSVYEFNNYRKTDFPFMSNRCFFTDDTVLTVAVADALLASLSGEALFADLCRDRIQTYARAYPGRGYGGRFARWIIEENPEPYGSFGNGSAMRVSACGFAAKDLEEAKRLARDSARVTHNHPEGLRGAEATAAVIRLALEGKGKDEIRAYVEQHYYRLPLTIDEIRPDYEFNETCQGTVPVSIIAFLEAESFEHAIRLAVSVGGDSDTLAAITGGMAEAFFGIPEELRSRALSFLDERLCGVVSRFEAKFPPKIAP